MAKVKCVKELRPATGDDSCIWRLDKPETFSLADWFDGVEVGEQVIFVCCEMTEKELDALPEFGGW